MATSITISGTEAGQYLVNTSSLSPLSNVVISDSNAGQIETVTVSLQAPGKLPAAGNGVLSNLGAGSYDASTGVYTVAGTAAEVTAALNNLVFTPTVADQPEHTVFAINVADSAGDTASNRITTVISAHPITIASNGVTTLASVANAFILENVSGSVVAFLKLNGSVVTANELTNGSGTWTPVGAVQAGTGYEVAWSLVSSTTGLPENQYVVWNVDSNGNFVSDATGNLSGANAAQAQELAGLEANFGELGANSEFLGAPPATPTPLGANGQLAELGTQGVDGNLFELNPSAGGPLLELNGMVVTSGQFAAGWTPIGAVQTGDGHEVAFSITGQNEYEVWNVGSNGDFTGDATGVLSGTSAQLEGVEASFGETFAGAGPAATANALGANGQLAELGTPANGSGDLFELNPSGRGPLLELNGAAVTSGQFAADWMPIAAVRTGDGYEVAFGITGQNEYEVWNVGSNGDFTGDATGVLSGTSAQLEGVEAAFGETFAGAGPAATANALGSNGQLAELGTPSDASGDLFQLNPAGGGPLLELNGAAVTAGQFAAGWTPIGAVQTATGYEVAFSITGQNKYEFWNVGSNGDFIDAATGVLSGTSYALEELELTFNEDLNGDGTVGPTTVPTGTNGALTQVANQFELNPGADGPFLELNGSPVTTTTFAAGWTPVGAVQTGTGYEVAFSISGKNEYEVWNVGSNGEFAGNATGILSGASAELEGVETGFGETFPGGGPLATANLLGANDQLAELGTPASGSGDLFQLNPAGGGPLLELNGSLVTAGQFAAGWSPIAAKETGDGYEVAFSINGQNQYEVWNVGGNGDFTGDATGILSGASAELEGVEASFGETFPGGGPLATANAIGANGQLAELGTPANASGDLFELNPGGGGPLLELNGSVVTAGQFAAGWTPVGAKETGDGYQVAFSINGQNQYEVWNVGSNGDFTGDATGILSGASAELEGVEASFGETFPGGGPLATANPIGANGQLAELGTPSNANGDVFELNPSGGGPLLEVNGSVATAGGLGGWTPVGAVQTATGYEVAWTMLNTADNQPEYTVWNTDSSGDYTSSAVGVVSGQNFNLEDLNPTFGENLNGAPSLSTFLATTVVQANSTQAQTQNTTIDLGNNSASSSNGLNSASNQVINGTPFDVTLGSDQDIVEYALAPSSGIEEVTGFVLSKDELNIALHGNPSDLLFANTLVGGVSAVSIYSSVDPSHGLLVLNSGDTAAQLQAAMTIKGGSTGQGHALITTLT